MGFISLLLNILIASWINYYVAKQVGRNQIGWAIGGAIFGILSTLVLIILAANDE